jgi:ribonuclease P protein component
MIGRLLQAADFKRLLAVPPAFRSAHFAIHHLVENPVRPTYAQKKSGLPELSTGRQDIYPQAVEDSGEIPQQESPDEGFSRWLGCVVPKRHARRAVTRNLIKRQVYAAAGRVEAALPGGMWLVRLRQPFAVTQYPSAASDALRAVVRQELDRMLVKAASHPGAKPVVKGLSTEGQPARTMSDAASPGVGAP